MGVVDDSKTAPGLRCTPSDLKSQFDVIDRDLYIRPAPVCHCPLTSMVASDQVNERYARESPSSWASGAPSQLETEPPVIFHTSSLRMYAIICAHFPHHSSHNPVAQLCLYSASRTVHHSSTRVSVCSSIEKKRMWYVVGLASTKLSG